jgi:hypothetical protein
MEARMRGLAMLGVLVVVSAGAHGQTLNAEQQRNQLLTWAREQALMTFTASAARACGLRDQAWHSRVIAQLAQAERSARDEITGAIPGAGAGASAFMAGAGYAGTLLGEAEATHRRATLCPTVSQGRALTFLDEVARR